MSDDPKTDRIRPGHHYQRELARDQGPVPDFLREVRPNTEGPDAVPIAKYISPDYHQLEAERLWGRSWQWACREEQIPEVGDVHVYEIGAVSVLVVRVTAGEIKAYRNTCLHRGRQLCDYDQRVTELRCPFHGFSWNLDGSFRGMPLPWELPQVDRAGFGLPEVRVARWGGFVFINLDALAAPLEDTLGVIPEHFARWELDRRMVIANVSKVMRCNWKVNQEGFLETWHVIATHPQLLASFGAVTGQYDVFGPVSRAMSALMGETPALPRAPTEQERVDSLTYQYLAGAQGPRVPEGVRARDWAAGKARAHLESTVGEHARNFCDAELLDTIAYAVFPNMLLFGGPGVRQIYRWRPWQNRHDMSVMDVVMLAPVPREGERPASAPHRLVGPDESWRVATELGGLALIEDQDAWNLEAVQKGLQGAAHTHVQLAKYQESMIRAFHRQLDAAMAQEPKAVRRTLPLQAAASHSTTETPPCAHAADSPSPLP